MVDDREGLAPVALAGKEPVAELVRDGALAEALGLEPRDHLRLGFVGSEPVQKTRVGRGARVRVGRFGHVATGDDLDDRQVEGPGEFPVALVVTGHGHDGARAVAGEHVVGDPDRDRLAVGRVGRRRAGRDTGLGAGIGHAVALAAASGALDVRLDLAALGVGRDLRHELVLGGKHHVGRAEEGVRARGEDLDLRRPALRRLTADHEAHVRALGPADPVALHLLDRLGPVETVEVFDQAVGVLGDPQHPLFHGHADDRVAPDLALAVDHLFVGEDRAELRAPVDRHLGLVGEAALVELSEYPLGPFDVIRIGRVDFARPVVGEAEGLDLALEVLDVGARRDPGMGAGLDRVLLGGQAEGVPTHRVKDVEPTHPLVAGHDVGRGIALGVADVESVPGWVGEHVEHVVLGLRRVDFGAERLVFQPEILPLRFDCGRVVGHGPQRMRSVVRHVNEFRVLESPDSGATRRSGEPITGRSAHRRAGDPLVKRNPGTATAGRSGARARDLASGRTSILARGVTDCAAIVPEPGTALRLSSGLASLVEMRRRAVPKTR